MKKISKSQLVKICDDHYKSLETDESDMANNVNHHIITTVATILSKTLRELDLLDDEA